MSPRLLNEKTPFRNGRCNVSKVRGTLSVAMKYVTKTRILIAAAIAIIVIFVFSADARVPLLVIAAMAAISVLYAIILRFIARAVRAGWRAAHHGKSFPDHQPHH